MENYIVQPDIIMAKLRTNVAQSNLGRKQFQFLNIDQ